MPSTRVGTKIVKDVASKVTQKAEKILPKAEETVAKAGTDLKDMPVKQDLVPSPKVVEASSDTASALIKAYAGQIESKLARYMRMLPEHSKMQKPFVFEIDGVKYEMMVDKTGEKLSKATIKCPPPYYKGDTATLEISFDKSGQMVYGDFSAKDVMSKGCYHFSRSPKNKRKITYDSKDVHIEYCPVAGNDQWAPIKKGLSDTYSETPEWVTSARKMQQPLGALFLELAGLTKSII